MSIKQEHKDLILELVKLFKPKTYVEIGARFGYLFNAVSPLVERSIAVDLRLKGIKQKQGVECYQMDSKDFAKKWKDPIDFLFIDADHDAKAVLTDFKNFAPFVKENTGLILLHDTYPVSRELLKKEFCSDAWKIARKIHKLKVYSDYEIVTLPGPNTGLSIIRKAVKHGWMDR